MTQNRYERFKSKALKDPEVRKSFEEGKETLRYAIRVAQLRERSGLTQTQVAKRANMTQAMVSRLENGENVKIETLLKVLHVLNADLSITAHGTRNRSHKGEP